MINKTHTTVLLTALALGIGSASATLLSWQNQVTGSGTVPAATHFSTVDGASPENINVGALTGPRSFEFIVNAGAGGVSQALLGDRNTNTQGIKFEQWNDTGNFGLTDFGVADYNSGVPYITGTDVHVVMAYDGFDTFLYLNGADASALTYLGVALTITGDTSIGASQNPNLTYFDNLDGQILGFASYDTALDAIEIQSLSDTYFSTVPEPSSSALLGLGGIALIMRRRK